MIDLRQYYKDKSIKAGRKFYIPKKYIIGFALLHKGEKSSSIFQRIKSIDQFRGIGQSRKEYDYLIEETFELGDVNKIIAPKDFSAFEYLLDTEYPFKRSLEHGISLIRQYLDINDNQEIGEEEIRRLLNINVYELNKYREKYRNFNSAINQNIFDFVIARDAYLNEKPKSMEEITCCYFELLIYRDLLKEIVDNVKSEYQDDCLRTLRMLSLNISNARLEIDKLSDLKDIDINNLYFIFGDNIGVLVSVLNYFSANQDDVIPQVINNFIDTLDNETIDILYRRQTETLDAIGQTYGLTRERVRQIEKFKGIDVFNEYYLDNLSADKKNLIFIFPKKAEVFPLSLMKDKLSAVNYLVYRNLMEYISYAGDAKYYRDIDAVVENKDTYEFLISMFDEIIGNYFRSADYEDVISECLESLEVYGVNRDTVSVYIDNNYKNKQNVYIKNSFKFSKAVMTETIVKEYFDKGFHFSDMDQINEFNSYCMKEFGIILFPDEEKDPTHHILQAVLQRCNVRLIDRGTYIHASKAVDLPPELLIKIISYLNSKRRAVGYANIFDTFKPELEEIGITNKYALQGAMLVYEGKLYKGSRDYACPITVSDTLRESMANWVASQQGLFSFDDFEHEFKGAAQSVFMSVIYEVGRLAYYWGRGYVSVDKLHIVEADKGRLRMFLDQCISQYSKGYCSADEYFDVIKVKMPDFITKCNIVYSYDLFSIIQILFTDQYKFSRPFVGKLDAIFENIYEIVDSYLESKTIVKLRKMRVDIGAKTKSNSYLTVLEIIKYKWNEFVAIDFNTIVRKDAIKLSRQDLVRLDSVLEGLFLVNDKVDIEKDIINCYFFNEIAMMPVNKFLLFGLINTFLHDKYDVISDTGKYVTSKFTVVRK